MGPLSLVTLFVVLQGFLGVDALGTCADKRHKATDCARTPYDVKVAASAGACCELCASEDACVQWTFHALSRKCSRTNSSESLEAGISTLLSTCGIRTSPGPSPGPSPPPSPGTDSIWAVIAAGSKGFSNYRHQADACHAYQILKKTGVPEDHIILMMQDDIAHSSSNPFPGKLFNKPGDDSQDVYDGCKVDYSGDQVTAQLFLSVITGDESAVPAGGKVLKSGKSDRVFLNFVDHGGVGIIAFPNGPVLHNADLSAALKTMQQKEMFNELVFYMEACESGSMFPDLTPDGKIFAVTAANADESSWGYYCMPQNDTVQGKHLGTCLGDLFSIAWLEDSDLGQLATESIREQVARVTARTTKSHVMTFGDESFETEHIGKFQEAREAEEAQAVVITTSTEGAVDIRDIPLRQAYYAWERSPSGRGRAAAWEALQAVVASRKADEELFYRIAKSACKSAGYGCTYGMQHDRHHMRDAACHRALAHAVHEACPRRGNHNPGGWNEFNMQFSQTLVNLCEAKDTLKKQTAALQEIVRAECTASSEGAGVLEVVV